MTEDRTPNGKESRPAPDTPDGEQRPAHRAGDPGALARNAFRLIGEGGRVVAGLAGRANGAAGPYGPAAEMGEAAKALGAVAGDWARDPARLLRAQGRLAGRYADLWGRSVRRLAGEDVPPAAEPERGDPRFRDPDWSQKPFFDFWKQAYLLTAQWADEMVEQAEGVDEKTKQRAGFYIEQISSAMAPSNFVLTNPEVVRETLASNGGNLVGGMRRLADDLERSKDVLRLRQTDPDAFEVGRNLAVTPGKVVFQNDLFQLIQYAPTTQQVYAAPLLIVPPWINKYYILDLVPEKSFVKWAVDQGFTVFVVSWVNPDARLAAKSFDDYRREGVLEAVRAALEATGEDRLNALGYCVGGTLLAATLGWMAAEGDSRVASATLLAAQTDFAQAGDLLLFIDDERLAALEEMMAREGYLDGARMAAVFNLLRPRDLLWPYIVENYLLGRTPLPFDLLYWNSDSTRLPAANHAFYLRAFYRDNRLAKGELELGGRRIDPAKVRLPVYELAAREDHIAPANSVYRGARLFGGPVRYVLAGSGHIAGVVNPPAKNKYRYWTGPDPAARAGGPATLDDWLSAAQEHPGSWWPDWSDWLAQYSGDTVPARTPGDGKLPPIEDAPGSYVKVKNE